MGAVGSGATGSGQVSRRGRGRYVVAALAALPLIEIVLAMVVASHIGWGVVALVILATMLTGSVVIRRGTPKAWATVRELSGRGPTPDHHRARAAGPTSPGPASDGRTTAGAEQVYSSRSARSAVGVDLASDVLLLLAGLGLLFPGLLSAAAGLVLLIPGIRRLAASRLATGIAASTQGRVNRMMASGQTVIITEVGGTPVRRTQRSEDAGQARFDPTDPPPPTIPAQ